MSKAKELLAKSESGSDEVLSLKTARKLLDSGDIEKAKAVIDQVIEMLIFGGNS